MQNAKEESFINSKVSRFQLKDFFLPVLLFILVVVTGLSIYEPSRIWIKTKLIPESRKLLARADGDLNGHGDKIAVIKVKTRTDLILEIYSLDADDNPKQLRSRLILPERRDAFFNFHGKPSNLILADLNQDGFLEIIAPTYDENLLPRLHVYKYDASTDTFQMASSDLLSVDSPKGDL